MTWTDGDQDARGHDPEATVLMPIVPSDGLSSADTTIIMPMIVPAPPDAPTVHVPLPPAPASAPPMRIPPGAPAVPMPGAVPGSIPGPVPTPVPGSIPGPVPTPVPGSIPGPVPGSMPGGAPVFRRPEARPVDPADAATQVIPITPSPAGPAASPPAGAAVTAPIGTTAPAAGSSYPPAEAAARAWHDMIDLPTETIAPPSGDISDMHREDTEVIDAAVPGGPLPPPDATDLPDEQPSVARSSAVMAVGSLVSRVTGLGRTVVLTLALGGALVGNNYNLANTLPNMVYELLLGGVLASVLVPFLVRARLNDTDRGQAYSQRLLTLATLLLGVATVLAIACAPLLTRLFLSFSNNQAANDPHQITLLSYLILPEIFFYGMAALFAAILNTRGHFAAPTFTPILNNIVVILTGVAVWVMPFAPDLVSADGLHHQPQITMAQTLVLGIGTTLGIVIQAIGLWPAMRKVRFRWRWRFDFRPLRLRELGRASVWMLLYVGVSQVALVALLILLNAASENGRNAGITVYNNAFLIFMMAHGIVAVSIMTALMPRLSAAAAEHRFGDVATQFAQGTRLSAVILVPATAAYIALGRPLAITLFEGGNLSHADAVKTGTVIAFAALGLVPFAISQMQLFAFYAMPDTKTPALLNIPVAALRVGLYALFYFALPSTLFAASLMGANTISYVLGAILGYALLRRRVGRLMLGETWRALARLAAAAAAGGVVAWLVVLGCEHVLGDGKAGSAVALVAGAITLGVVYLGAAVVLKANDVTDVIAMVRARLGR